MMSGCVICGQENVPLSSDRCARCLRTTAEQSSQEISAEALVSLPAVGERIAGNYQLIKQLGMGGMGVVFLAEDVALKRLVAVKFTLGPGASDEHTVERFLREARVMAKLDHPNIAPIYFCGVHHGLPFLVSKFLEGKDLAALEGNHQAFSIENQLKAFAQVASALDYMHARGLIHRDVKPSNVILGEDGNAFLIDLGIAREIVRSEITRSGMALGTPLYSPPEALLGEIITPASDQYALALLAYCCLTNAFPFTGTTDYAQTKQKLAGLSAEGIKAVPGFSTVAVKAFERAFHPDPQRRFEHCIDFAAALKSGFEPKAPEQVTTQRFSPRKRTVKGLLLWTAPVGLAAAVVGFWWWHSATPKAQSNNGELNKPLTPTIATTAVLPVPAANSVPPSTPPEELPKEHRDLVATLEPVGTNQKPSAAPPHQTTKRAIEAFSVRIKAVDARRTNAIIEAPFSVDGVRQKSLPQRMKLKAGTHRFVIEATDEYQGKAESRRIDSEEDVLFELEPRR
jgi:serine/threonine protein kinase